MKARSREDQELLERTEVHRDVDGRRLVTVAVRGASGRLRSQAMELDRDATHAQVLEAASALREMLLKRPSRRLTEKQDPLPELEDVRVALEDAIAAAGRAVERVHASRPARLADNQLWMGMGWVELVVKAGADKRWPGHLTNAISGMDGVSLIHNPHRPGFVLRFDSRLPSVSTIREMHVKEAGYEAAASVLAERLGLRTWIWTHDD